jgi:hypothetical protein
VSYTETEKVNALEMGMEIYEACSKDPATQPAAYGLAVSLVSTILHVSLRVAVFLVEEELTKRANEKPSI